MLEIASICVLLGAVLAARFKVIAVIAAVAVVLMVASAAGTTHDGWWVAIAVIVAAVALQLGSLGGRFIWLTILRKMD